MNELSLTLEIDKLNKLRDIYINCEENIIKHKEEYHKQKNKVEGLRKKVKNGEYW